MRARAGSALCALALGACFERVDLGGAFDAGTCAPPCARSCAATCTCDCPEEVTILGGTGFPMGCVAGDTSCAADELPGHSVTLSTYRIFRTEVTQRHYQACIEAGACTAPACNFTPSATPVRPVVCVRWSQAAAFCAWGGMRLPTEAEWEYAAKRDDRIYPWGNQPPDCTRAIMQGCGGQAADVGSLAGGVSPFGVADIAGNVSEWVADWYAAGYYAVSPGMDPHGPDAGTNKVIRGGSYLSFSAQLRASRRVNDAPELNALAELGFRCAR